MITMMKDVIDLGIQQNLILKMNGIKNSATRSKKEKSRPNVLSSDMIGNAFYGLLFLEYLSESELQFTKRQKILLLVLKFLRIEAKH